MKSVPRVYLDANVFIAAFENPGAYSDHAWWIMHAVERGEITAATSEITLAEVLVKPLQVGAADLADGYQQIIVNAPGFDVCPVARDVLVSAAELRAKRNFIRLPDAIHLATAMNMACSHIVSGDRRLPSIGEVAVLPISAFTLDDIMADRK